MPKTEDTKFVCAVCGIAFSRKFTYKRQRHCIRMHSEVHTENSENSSKTDNNVIMCHMCDKTFSRKYTLDRHLQNQHQVMPSQQPEDGEKNEEIACPICDKTYSCISARNRHAKQVHDLQMNNKNTTHICPECGERYINAKEINYHLKEKHDIDLDVINIKFSSMEEFESWKTKMEEEEQSSYIQCRGKKSVCEGTRLQFRCHRTGIPLKKENTERISFKSSVKTGAYCPSGITITELHTGEVEAKFIKHHVGHTTGLQYLRLTNDERAMLASRIASHIPLKQIIKDIRDSVSNETGISRLHMCDNKDLYNIIREFKLDPNKTHTNDVISVDMWIKQQKSMTGGIVYYHKEQGCDDPQGHLNREDFMLVIMTDYQKEVLKEFSQEKILIDSTHGTNAFSFMLTTLLTVDEYGAGIPASFCLSNRTDKDAMKVFFNVVKEKTGIIKSNIFMSDDAPAFYNAWSEVMGAPDHHLLCTWHVDKAWRDNVRIKIKSVEKAAEVYKGCRVLLEEQNQSSFKVMLEGFLNLLKNYEDTVSFAEYFQKHYYTRPELWAYCYRIRLGLNTNMYLEALHKKIKYCYLDGKKNRLVDKCIGALLQLCKDIMFERLIRHTKKKPTKRMQRIITSHKKSVDITYEMIKELSHHVWEVQSCMSTRGPYTVTLNSHKKCGCPLSCPICEVCVHQVSCTCIEHTSKLNICKHIHACIKIQQNLTCETEQNQKNVSEVDVDPEIKLVAECSTSVNPSMADSVSLSTQFQALLDVSKSYELNHPHLLPKFIERANLFIKDLDKIIENDQSKITETQDKIPFTPANKNLDKQRRFKSTVKRKQTTERALVKPGDQQKNVLSEMFRNAETANDAISIQCLGDPDHTY